MPAASQDRRHDVDAVMELRAHAALVRDLLRPGDHQRVARAAEMGRDLLAPLERRVHRPRPADRIVVVGGGAADLVQLRQQDGRVLGHAAQAGHLVERSVQAPLHGGAVVADHPEHQRVVGLTDLLERVEQAPHLVVGLRGVRREGLHQPRGHLLLIGGQRIIGGDLLGPRRELGVVRDHAELELAAEAVVAVLVPTLVELPLELVDPLLRNVVRGVGGTGRVVDEERPVGRHRLLLMDVLDRAVGQRVVERVVPLAPGRHHHLDRSRVLVQRRLPLIRFAADEAVEVVEPLHGRPAIERPGDAGLPVGDVVVLADERGAVAVLAQGLRHHRAALGDLAGVAGEAVAELGDVSGRTAVVVAPGQQRRTRGRTERGGVKAGVAQAALRQAVEVGRRHQTAERPPLTEAAVVDHDQQHIGRAGRRRDHRERPHGRILVGLADDPVELGIRRRQHHVTAGRRGRCSIQQRASVPPRASATVCTAVPVVLAHDSSS